jgi:hypothetical protein
MLDPDILAKTSQKVFSTSFQHFVSNNMSRQLGGHVISILASVQRKYYCETWNVLLTRWFSSLVANVYLQ